MKCNIHYDLTLVIHNGPDRGTVIDRIDSVDEYDLSKGTAVADLVDEIQHMIRYADGGAWK